MLGVVAGVATLGGLPALGAAGADALRAVAGDAAVARLEDEAYAVKDRLERFHYDGARPESRWAVSPRPVRSPDAAPDARPSGAAKPPAVPERASASEVQARNGLRDVGPMFTDFAAEGDGVWVPVGSAPDAERPVLHKTLLHPDRARSFAELFVVAVDLSRVALHFVAGSSEPENVAPGAEDYVRAARIPESEHGVLLAAFNGGFKTRHGHHGVMVDGVTLVPARDDLCTVLARPDGSLELGTWRTLENGGFATFFRQSARCLVENGVRHPALAVELTASWGAAVGGDTVIRRSAIGLDQDRRTLFVGVSRATTAAALADGMRHAGASVAAQLDVNEAFPRFLTYERDEKGNLVAESVAPGFTFQRQQYVAGPSSRDFFYLTRKVELVTTDMVKGKPPES